jgi:hypothetical protein
MRWFVALAGSLAAIALIVLFVGNDVSMPPPPRANELRAAPGATPADSDDPSRSGTGTTSPEDAPDATHRVAATLRRTAAPEPGLSGVVLDDRGEPLGRVLVYMRLCDSKYDGAEVTCTDGDGCFVFHQAVGRCVLSVENGLTPGLEITMALGECRFVELQATQPCIVLEGYVRSGGRPVADRQVLATGGKGKLVARETTDADGYYRHVLPAGKYVMQVAGSIGGIGENEGAPDANAVPMFGTHLVTLSAFVRRERCDFDVACAAIRVTVLQARDRRPVANALVRAVAGKRGLAARTDAAGVAELRELASATWRVTVEVSAHATVEPQEVEVSATDPAPRALTMLVAGAGSIQLVVSIDGGAASLEEDRRVPTIYFAAAPDALQLQLENGEVRRSYAEVDAAALQASVFSSDVPFAHVPPGRHELRCADSIGPSGCVFAPCDPFRVPVEVRADQVTIVPLHVVRRPVLRLALGQSGGLLVPGVSHTLMPTIRGSRGVVQFPPAWWSGGYGGAVVPGEYTITVGGPTGPIEETVTVGNQDVLHVVRPSATATVPVAPSRK